MITFERVTKRYPNGHDALNQIDFCIEKGEMVFLTGHSGAGKSTVLKLIMCNQRSSQGKVMVNSVNANRIAKRHIPRLRRSMGLIFQDPHLLADKTIFDNVALPLMIAGYRPQEIARRVRAALDKVNLLNKEKFYPAALSGGEQQRIGIARAVVNKPTIILADEPTGNLDPGLSAEIMQLFEEFNRVGVTILIASHDLALIAQMKHRIMTLHQGRMVSSGVKFADEK